MKTLIVISSIVLIILGTWYVGTGVEFNERLLGVSMRFAGLAGILFVTARAMAKSNK